MVATFFHQDSHGYLTHLLEGDKRQTASEASAQTGLLLLHDFTIPLILLSKGIQKCTGQENEVLLV